MKKYLPKCLFVFVILAICGLPFRGNLETYNPTRSQL